MISIYHLGQSRSDRVLWLMEELGEPYELSSFERGPDMMAPAAYRALHPMGTSPIVRDGDLTLVETGAIVEYILSRYGNGRLEPKACTREHAMYLQWLHFAEGSAAFSFLTEAILLRASQKNAAPSNLLLGLQQVWRNRNDRTLPYLDDELGRSPYFAGEAFTAADIMMAYTFGIFERFLNRPLTPFENIIRYCAKVFERPAYKRAMAVAYPEGQ